MSTHPEVLWAQRSSATVSEKNVIYLTINLPDINPESLEYTLNATNLSFKARTSGDANYEFNLEFYAEVDPEKSKSRLTSRNFSVSLRKKESKIEYWPRLTKDKRKIPFIKTDFGRWVDEDEQDENTTVDDDLDPSGFQGMGSDFDLSKFSNDFGAGGAGGFAGGANDVAEEESDDEGPPPLEDAEVVQ